MVPSVVPPSSASSHDIEPSMGFSTDDPLREQASAFEALLDPARESLVEISTLRRLAARGIPGEPSHLRPLTYSLLLGVIGKRKAEWESEWEASRRQYGHLAEGFLGDAQRAKPPQGALSENDHLLDSISKDVRRTQTSLGFFDQPIPSSSSTARPCVNKRALVDRLALIAASHFGSTTLNSLPIPRSKPLLPDIEVQRPTAADAGGEMVPPSPSLSVRSDGTVRPPIFEDMHDENANRSASVTPEQCTDLPLPPVPSSTSCPSSPSLPSPPQPPSKQPPSKDDASVNSRPVQPSPSVAEDLHSDALTRILYTFSLMNPNLNYTQGFSELLAPLYHAYASSDRAGGWAEADAFWAFVALMADVGDVVKGPGEKNWLAPKVVSVQAERDVKWAMKRLSMRVKWADELLWDDLRSKSLDPVLPYWSFRWISTMLAQDFPLPSLLRIWDAVLSEPPTTRISSPKVDLLLDVCTAMLLRARKQLLRAGLVRAPSGRWLPPASPSSSSPSPSSSSFELDSDPEFGEGFVQGMALLQRFPVEEVGGLEAILDLAYQSRQRRILGEMNGDEPEEYDDGPSELPAIPASPQSISSMAAGARRRLFGGGHRTSLSISSILSDATDRSADFPDNVSEASQASAVPSVSSSSSRFDSLRKYAEAFKESDTAAALAKTSSNLTAAALDRWSGDGVKLSTQTIPGAATIFDASVPAHEEEKGGLRPERASWTAAMARQVWGGGATAVAGAATTATETGAAAPDDEDDKPLGLLQSAMEISRSTSPRPEFKSAEGSNESVPTSASTPPFDAAPSMAVNRSLQDRLAASLGTPSSLALPSSSSQRKVSNSSPKPLLLSTSARPAGSALPPSPAPHNAQLPSSSSAHQTHSQQSSASSSSSTRPPWATESPTSPPTSSDSDASHSSSTRGVRIGGARSRRSLTPSVSSPPPSSSSTPTPRATFLKTAPNSAVRLRELSNSPTASSPILGRGLPPGITQDFDKYTRPAPRSPRPERTLSRPQSSSGVEVDAGSSSRPTAFQLVDPGFAPPLSAATPPLDQGFLPPSSSASSSSASETEPTTTGSPIKRRSHMSSTTASFNGSDAPGSPNSRRSRRAAPPDRQATIRPSSPSPSSAPTPSSPTHRRTLSSLSTASSSSRPELQPLSIRDLGASIPLPFSPASTSSMTYSSPSLPFSSGTHARSDSSASSIPSPSHVSTRPRRVPPPSSTASSRSQPEAKGEEPDDKHATPRRPSAMAATPRPASSASNLADDENDDEFDDILGGYHHSREASESTAAAATGESARRANRI